MELDFCNEGPVTFDKYEIIYQQLLTKTISHLRLGGDYYVSVTIIDNETIHGINKQYRNVDRPTDVISFAFLDIIFSICKILSTASFTAGSIKPHVFITIISAFSGFVSIS